MWVRRATANRSARSDGISALPGSDLVSGVGESGVGEKGSRPTGVPEVMALFRKQFGRSDGTVPGKEK